jgi:hypothetical protein
MYLKMSIKLVNIALASAFYEQKKNYLHTYLLFIIKAFAGRSVLDLKEISNELHTIFGIHMPISSLKQILSLDNGKFFCINKLSRHRWTIELTVDGKSEYSNIYENEIKQSGRLEVFYNSLLEFSKRKFRQSFSLDELKLKVQEFVIDNLIDISLKRPDNSLNERTLNRFGRVFINYIFYIKKNSVENAQIFEDVWKGTIIWNEIRKPELSREALKRYEARYDAELALHLRRYARKNYFILSLYVFFTFLSVLAFIGVNILEAKMRAIGVRNFAWLTMWAGPIVIFLIPAIRSFVKHEKVWLAILFILLKSEKNRLKAIQKETFRAEYEKNNGKPQTLAKIISNFSDPSNELIA